MLFKKKEKEVDQKEVVTSLLSYILQDDALNFPVYLSEIKTEKDAHKLGIAPLIYIWNEDKEEGSFTVSVNGNALAHLLEGAVPREHSLFNEIRDEAMDALVHLTRKNVISICEQSGTYPSEIFAPQE